MKQLGRYCEAKYKFKGLSFLTSKMIIYRAARGYARRAKPQVSHVPTRSLRSYDVLEPIGTEAPIQFRSDMSQLPRQILLPPYIRHPDQPLPPRQLVRKPESVWPKLRASGQLAAQVLKYAGKLCTPGRTTAEIDRLCYRMILEHDAYPSPLGYHGFPKSICTSVNNVVCHGIPNERPLREGDLVSVDVTVYKHGYHGDTCATFMVGQVDDLGKDLVETTHEATLKAIERVKPGLAFNAIGKFIEDYASAHGYKSVREFCGHGIGEQFHELPYIFHCRNNEQGTCEPGLVFTIEPMLVEGSNEVEIWGDKWTVTTCDGGRCAQFEHTVLVTDTGVEILTLLL